MTNYSDNPGDVRVDRFKAESGKWYDTFTVDMSSYYSVPDIFAAVEMAVSKKLGGERADWGDWIIVVAEPYHKNAYPIMLKKFDAQPYRRLES